MSDDCLFCKIVAGDLPCDKVWEDDNFFAFMDIKPVNPGHCLVVPKKHYDCLADMPDDDVGDLYMAAVRIARAAVKAVAAPGFNIAVNNGAAAGQLVFHTHIHVMPRFEDDGHQPWNKKDVPEERTASLAEEIGLIMKE